MDVKGKLSGLLHLAPYASFFNDLAETFLGKQAHGGAAGEKPEKYGIFSKKDEAKVAKLILAMEEADSEDVVGFLALVFNPQRKRGQPVTFQHFFESIWFRNDFFSHLATLADKGAPKKKGVEKVVKKENVGGVDTTTTTETDVFDENSDKSEAEKLLETLAKRIQEERKRVDANAAPSSTEETLRRRTYLNVYKRYYKGDFTTCIRMVGEDDTRIWERFGFTQERWQQFSKWAAPFTGRAIKLVEQAVNDGGRGLRTLIENEAARIRADNRITPEVWTRGDIMRKLKRLPRNLFLKAWKRLMRF